MGRSSSFYVVDRKKKKDEAREFSRDGPRETEQKRAPCYLTIFGTKDICCPAYSER